MCFVQRTHKNNDVTRNFCPITDLEYGNFYDCCKTWTLILWPLWNSWVKRNIVGYWTSNTVFHLLTQILARGMHLCACILNVKYQEAYYCLPAPVLRKTDIVVWRLVTCLLPLHQWFQADYYEIQIFEKHDHTKSFFEVLFFSVQNDTDCKKRSRHK